MQLVAGSPDAVRREHPSASASDEQSESHGTRSPWPADSHGERDSTLTPQPPSRTLRPPTASPKSSAPMPMPSTSPSSSGSGADESASSSIGRQSEAEGTAGSSTSLTQQASAHYPSTSSAAPAHGYRSQSHQSQSQEPVQDHAIYTPALRSPCFVHSYLDKGASLADWLKSKQRHAMSMPSSLSHRSSNASASTSYSGHPHGGVGKHQHHHVQASHPTVPLPPSEYSPSSSPDSEMDDEDGSSLTRQLADTAVGVREISKQLGESTSYFLLPHNRACMHSGASPGVSALHYSQTSRKLTTNTNTPLT